MPHLPQAAPVNRFFWEMGLGPMSRQSGGGDVPDASPLKTLKTLRRGSVYILTFFLAYTLTLDLTLFLAFSLACVWVPAWPTAGRELAI